jgi:tRNA-specific 2-thiouridylase
MKAIALISGGLDSLLAARCIQGQGITVLPLHFKIPFCHYDRDMSDKTQALSVLVKNNLGLELKQVDISNEFLSLLDNPRYGFGSNMNPCIDCKILMLAKAKELMAELGASFVVTGEVLGQRPMSQHRHALQLIEKKSGLEGLLLRPLSAKRLTETIPEKECWVDRSKLLDFSGRVRRPQIELAESLHLENYPNASGGCLLTDPEFAKRLKDLMEHSELTIDAIELLRYGRHFRLGSKTKLVVGRNEKEDIALDKQAKDNDYLFYPSQETAGPTSLGKGELTEELIRLSCEITCRYCDLNGNNSVNIVYKRFGEEENITLNVSPIKEVKLISLRI